MSETPIIYNTIGHGYRGSRAADPRIVEQLLAAMNAPPGAVICDVGAGSGNYANAMAARGYSVLAVEPSVVMRVQADPHERVSWYDGVAERLPLPDAAAQAGMCVLAVHHFRSLAATAHELDRVCGNGAFVFFTFDPHGAQSLWLNDYFPEIGAEAEKLFPPMDDFVAAVQAETGRSGEVTGFPLPSDLKDGFLQAPWNRPETYLDAGFRANSSGFAKADPAHVARGLARHESDLKSGAWDRRNGGLRAQASFDAGYRFVVFRR